MTVPKRFASLAMLACCVGAVEAAGTVEMQGTVSYRIADDVVTIEIDRIENKGARHTGELHVTMWLTEGADPYTDGWAVARRSLAYIDGAGTLGPGRSYQDIRFATEYRRPPPGAYYVHVFVSEAPDLNTSLDLLTFTERLRVRRVVLEGTVSYRVRGDQVTLEVDRVVNHGDAATGELHLTMWLTADPDPFSSGHRAARESLAYIDGSGVLGARGVYDDVSLTTGYRAPSAGTYYVHVFVSEAPDLNTALDLRTFTNTLAVEEKDDHGDVPADATHIPVPSATRGHLGHPGDRDVFRVEVERPGWLGVTTGGTTDTHGTLSDAHGTVVGTDDDEGDDLNFFIVARVAPGDWFIEVRGFDKRVTGGYRLVVVLLPDPIPPAHDAPSRHLGDFDGDGRDDVLLRDGSTGEWVFYAMNGREGTLRTTRMTRNLSYRLAGSGDFDGDGQDDVLLRHAENGAWIFYATVGTRAALRRVGITRNANYRFRGIGDFNGDGRDDVLLRHRGTGAWIYYAMNGTRAALRRVGMTRDANYRFAGTGDLNGDGRDDVLLRHAETGAWIYYEMSGTRATLRRTGLTDDRYWRFNAMADFDGDGRAEVLLRDDRTGAWSIHALEGGGWASRGVDLTRDGDYRFWGTGDFDGDGRGDMLLRHAETGVWRHYALDGDRYVSAEASLNADLALSIVTGVATGSISGTLAVAEGQVLDGDTNDPRDPVLPNDTDGRAQRVPVPVSVAGHADAARDEWDVYRVSFPAATRVNLAISDPDAADLDLYLTDAEGTILEQSLGVGTLEAVQTTRTGPHLVKVRAYSGAGNYSLVLSIVDAADEASAGGNGTSSMDGSFVSGELIVQPRVGRAGEAERVLAAQAAGLVTRARTPAGALVTGPDGAFATVGSPNAPAEPALRYAYEELRERARTLLLRKRLLASGAFEHVTPNYLYRSMAVPNDPHYRHQWHYPQIELQRAWDITKGDDDIVVAVIDTGVVTDHPDLGDRLLRDGSGRIVGYDFISDPDSAGDGDGIDTDPFDVGDSAGVDERSSFHGTHVAGTVGAETNNGIGVAGVTWRGRIMPVRVLGKGGGTSWDIAQGIRYAAGLPNDSGTVPPVRADVINLSLGLPNPDCMRLGGLDPTRGGALEDAIAAGVTVVVAAGNDNCHEPAPMSLVEGVISVGATGFNDRAPYSNFGSTLDVVAPGGDGRADLDGDGYPDGILSTTADDGGGSIEPSYNLYQGTSMAAPHVAGVVALMLAANPDLTPTDINRLIAGTHADPAAERITHDWGDRGRDDVFGHGLIDAYRAVEVARAIVRGGDGPPPRGILAVAPTRLHFGATANVLRAQLKNLGDAPVQVSSVEPDAAWLAVSLDEWPTLVVEVDREGLGEDTYVGRIAIASDGGDLTVPVSMQVWRGATADIGTVYVLALSPDTLEAESGAGTNERLGYAFEMPSVPFGEYIVAAGTDRDGDDYICDEGEACGIWPRLDGPVPLEVEGDETASFGVSIDLFARVSSQSVNAVDAGKIPARGFAIPSALRGPGEEAARDVPAGIR